MPQFLNGNVQVKLLCLRWLLLIHLYLCYFLAAKQSSSFVASLKICNYVLAYFCMALLWQAGVVVFALLVCSFCVQLCIKNK